MYIVVLRNRWVAVVEHILAATLAAAADKLDGMFVLVALVVRKALLVAQELVVQELAVGLVVVLVALVVRKMLVVVLVVQWRVMLAQLESFF